MITSLSNEIASAYNVPYVDLTDDNYFTSGMFEGSIVNGHPLAYGYCYHKIDKKMHR